MNHRGLLDYVIIILSGMASVSPLDTEWGEWRLSRVALCYTELVGGDQIEEIYIFA